MKRGIRGLLLFVLTIVMLTACGSNKAESNETDPTSKEGVAVDVNVPLSRMEVEKLVTLGDYKNLQIEVAAATVKEEDLSAFMSQVYIGSLTEELGGIKDRAVAEGDTVIMDYEGKKDGVAFEGGTAKGADLVIGSGAFIPGFEDGLVGVMPGETVDLNLTFPEAYHSTDLAGQAVVFTVTVHYILPSEVKESEMKDEVIQTMGINDVNTVEEFKEFAREYLQTTVDNNYQLDVQDAILKALLDKSEFEEIPEELLELYKKKLQESLETTASRSGMDANSYANYVYGMNLQQVVDRYAENSMRQELVLQAIANAENLNVTDEELENELQEYTAQAGLSSVEELIGNVDREEYRNFFMSEKVIALLTENAQIIEK